MKKSILCVMLSLAMLIVPFSVSASSPNLTQPINDEDFVEIFFSSDEIFSAESLLDCPDDVNRKWTLGKTDILPVKVTATIKFTRERSGLNYYCESIDNKLVWYSSAGGFKSQVSDNQTNAYYAGVTLNTDLTRPSGYIINTIVYKYDGVSKTISSEYEF